VWIPPAAVREARELVRHRVSLIWLRTQVRNRMLAMLARRNLQPTQAKRWLTVRGQRELQTLALTAAPTTIREDSAKRWASTLSFFRRAEAIAFVSFGCESTG
jgi:hypothetical protein